MHNISNLMSFNVTVFNVMGISSDRCLLFWIFRRPINRSYPSSLKELIKGKHSALHTCSRNQKTNRPLATETSAQTLLNVVLCNLKFFPKTLCSPSLLHWKLSVVWTTSEYLSFWEKWMNKRVWKAIPCCNVSGSAVIKLPTVTPQQPDILRRSTGFTSNWTLYTAKLKENELLTCLYIFY